MKSVATAPLWASKARLQSLPREIVDYIVGFLWDDKNTLRACSLASRVCRHAAQMQLFRTLIFRNPTGNPTHRLSMIAASSHIPTFIRHLYYAESALSEPWDDFARSMPSRAGAALQLRTAHFAVSPASETAIPLRQFDVSWPGMILAATFWSKLSSLTLRGATFQNMGQLSRLVEPLQKLRFLELDPVVIHTDISAKVTDPVFNDVCNLRVSFVGMPSLAAMLPWLAAGAAKGNVSVQVLSVPLQTSDSRPLAQLFGCAGSGIAMLQLVAGTSARNESWDALMTGFGCLSSLRVLSVDTGYIPNPVFFKYLGLVISSIPHLSLLVLDTGRMCHIPFAMEAFDWDSIDDAVAEPRRRTVVQVTFTAPQDWEIEFEKKTRLSFVRLLPRIAATDRFRFVAKRESSRVTTNL
ncbi:hypothetical protein BKA62DRAFT_662692 [Auriculariales sp. MPI-PUGE-AT-0066]|nr:hypothetical protein BKA62DRAFT_662692 [Auriculariales sp. MPI-PUGE-AT-0066]